jgi:proteic killer suppression protein
VIISFADEETRHIYDGLNTKKARSRLSRTLWNKAQMKLDMIHRAHKIDDLKIPPNNKLEKLSGDLMGKYSIRINDQYRIVFEWTEKGVSEVKIIDYH